MANRAEDRKQQRFLQTERGRRDARRDAVAQLSERDEVEVDVTFEDQGRINLFGRLNAAASELREEIKRKTGRRHQEQKLLEALQDAGNELLLADEDDPDAVTYQIGENFVQLSREAVEKRLADQEAQLKDDVSKLKAQVDEFAKEMAQLKALLYAKFKTSINLETDDA